MNSPKLYVLVRNDLSKSQQAVQAAHAAIVAAVAGVVAPDSPLVLLRVRDLDELQYWYSKSESSFPFYEPDIGMEMTAFATHEVVGGFENLRLL